MPGRERASTKAKDSKKGSGFWPLCSLTELQRQSLSGSIPQAVRYRTAQTLVIVNTASEISGCIREWVAMILEPFGDLSEAKISIAYCEKTLECDGRVYHVPRLVVLEYPNGLLRLLKESELGHVFARLIADCGDNDSSTHG